MAATKIEFMIFLLSVYHTSAFDVNFLSGPHDATWQPVKGVKYKMFVYSAFLDNRSRDHPVVRVVAVIWKNHELGTLNCNIVLRHKSTVTVLAEIQIIKDQNKSLFSAAFVLCPLYSTYPYYAVGGTVSITPENLLGMPAGNKLPVLDIEPKEREKNSFNMCVPPLYSEFNYTVNRLLEWIEMSRLLGISRILVYNNHIPRKLSCILEAYSQIGVVEIRDWHWDLLDSDMTIPVLHQAALQDCLYRSMSSAEHVVVSDLDEFLMPRMHHTLQGFIRRVRATDRVQPKPSAYLFRTVFFYTFWPDDAYAPAQLMTSRKTLRTEEPLPYKDRSKYIVRPYHAVELGFHYVTRFAGEGFYVYEVPPEKALLAKYKDSCIYKTPLRECWRTRSVLDRNAHKWTRQLLDTITEARDTILVNCSLS